MFYPAWFPINILFIFQVVDVKSMVIKGTVVYLKCAFQDAIYIDYLTIIPQARMGSESIAHEAEGRMGSGLGGHEGERNNCFSKIQLVGKKKYRD